MPAKISKFPSRSLDKFVLRLPDGMRESIGELARINQRTMNAEIVSRLEQSLGLSKGADAATSAHFAPGTPAEDILLELHQMVGKLSTQVEGVSKRMAKLEARKK